MNIIKNRCLKLFVIASLSLNAVNTNSFSIRNLGNFLTKQKNNVANWCRKNPEVVELSISVAAITAFVAGVIGLVEWSKRRYNKKLKNACILCDELNENCKCNLGEKILYTFRRYSFTKVNVYYENIPVNSYCRWRTKEIVAVLSKIHDINMKFPTEDNAFTILHLACIYGHKPITKWLVDEMFVDISIPDNHGNLASDILEKHTSLFQRKINNPQYKDDLFYRSDIYFLKKRMKIQEKFLDTVKTLQMLAKQNDLDKKSSSEVKAKLKEIKKAIYSKKTPGFAKQLALPDLIAIHKKIPTYITEKNIKTFYKYVAFNYTFLHDTRFSRAVEFAEANGITDIYKRTVEQARQVYKAENKGVKTNAF